VRAVRAGAARERRPRAARARRLAPYGLARHGWCLGRWRRLRPAAVVPASSSRLPELALCASPAYVRPYPTLPQASDKRKEAWRDADGLADEYRRVESEHARAREVGPP
jgi:hypothetical protein